MRILVVAGIAFAAAVGSSGVAQSQPGRVAINACSDAVTWEVRGRYPQAQRVQFLGSGKLRQASNAETSVSGKGQFDSRSGWTNFSYHCTYNRRSGQTYGIDVRTRGSASAGGSDGGHNAGKIIGAALGAIIAGAIVNSINKTANKNTAASNNEWWSPSPGVQCSSYQSACYVNGSFSPQWTHRIYVR